MDSNGPSIGYMCVIDGFYVGTSRLSMGFKGRVFAVTRFSSYFLIVFKNCYGIGNNV